MHGSKHRKDNQSLKHLAKYPSWECEHDTNEFRSNDFNFFDA